MDKWDQILESAIIGRVIGEMIENNFRIEISDQDGGGLHIYGAADNGERPAGGYDYWVVLVPGNGKDVISDYSTNLEEVIKPALELAIQFD